MKKTNKFSPEVRERAVRMVQEHRGEYPSLWAATIKERKIPLIDEVGGRGGWLVRRPMRLASGHGPLVGL